MAEDDDLDAYKDISELKRQIEGVKDKKDVSAKDLYSAVQNLAQTMNDMLEVFGTALEQMKEEEKEVGLESKKHEVIIVKLDKIISQNKTIAEGMVAIVDLIKEKMVAPARQKQETQEHTSDKFESFFNQTPEQTASMKPTPFEWQPKQEPMMQRAQPQVMPSQRVMSPQSIERPLTHDFGPDFAGEPIMPRPQQSMTPLPRPQPMMPPPTMMPPAPSLDIESDLGLELPPMEPAPMPDFDFPEESPKPKEEPKKKGLFGMFKK